MNSIAVIGIGQSLRGDDGVGLVAVSEWQASFKETATKPEVRCEACELPGLELLEILSQARYALFVDAIQSTEAPGLIHVLDEDVLAGFTAGSVHGWGLAETLQLYRTLATTPVTVKVIGITASQFEIGTGLSEPVRATLPTICKQIENLIQDWL